MMSVSLSICCKFTIASSEDTWQLLQAFLIAFGESATALLPVKETCEHPNFVITLDHRAFFFLPCKYIAH
jgi:hypothetical protein